MQRRGYNGYGLAPLMIYPMARSSLIDSQPHLILGEGILPWSWSGYSAPKPRPQGPGAIILTPPSAMAVLREGYQPELHPSVH